jgi:hypothetical protein
MNPRIALVVLTFVVRPAPAAPTAGVQRTVPPECAATAAALDVKPGAAAREWNRQYTLTYESIENGRLDAALDAACTSLALGVKFGARDWRFAETLDELGLIHYQQGDMESSARAQARAVAEVLLAKGPAAPEVALYAGRLAMPLGRLDRDALAKDVIQSPHRIFATEYVEEDAALAKRLDWLVAEELRLENLAAANELQALIDRIDAQAPPAVTTDEPERTSRPSR